MDAITISILLLILMAAAIYIDCKINKFGYVKNEVGEFVPRSDYAVKWAIFCLIIALLAVPIYFVRRPALIKEAKAVGGGQYTVQGAVTVVASLGIFVGWMAMTGFVITNIPACNSKETADVLNKIFTEQGVKDMAVTGIRTVSSNKSGYLCSGMMQTKGAEVGLSFNFETYVSDDGIHYVAIK